METMIPNKEPKVPLTDAAFRLKYPWDKTWKMVLTGKLRGEKREGRWYVDAADLERLVAEREGQ